MFLFAVAIAINSISGEFESGSIVLSKNSLLAALGTFGIYMALNISSGIISVFTDQAWILNHLPGSGAAGFVRNNGTAMRSISTG